ncbi:hypothetical protein [Haloarcula amylovorans]|uniref:hypothetical protein n=1 Tax=Haloarcula amylovorans TaxID=2562280 RepID=UPI001FD72EC6|nr:hypothetical protein [Halomicroarcula amylolytica]
MDFNSRSMREPGLSGKESIALIIWVITVAAVLRAVRDVLLVSGEELAVVAGILIFGSFYGVFMPVWCRLPDWWKK